MKKTIEELANIIRDNPGCVAIIDNDYWSLHGVHPDLNPHDDGDDEDAQEAWLEENELICSDEMAHSGFGYGEGNSYGGDILQALALIVGIKVESV